MISVVCSVAGSTNGSHATPARETNSAQISHRRYSTVPHLPVTSYIPTDTNGDLITEAWPGELMTVFLFLQPGTQHYFGISFSPLRCTPRCLHDNVCSYDHYYPSDT